MLAPTLVSPRRSPRVTTVGRIASAILAGGSAAGCQGPRLVLDPPPLGAQTTSLLGDTLWLVRFPSHVGQRRVSQLVDAQRQSLARPDDVAVELLLGRRTAGMGRFREALDVYTTALERTPGDPRLLRRRGEMLLLLREPDLAAAELRRAIRKTGADSTKQEIAEGPTGELVATGLLFQANLLLGVAHYVRGDHARAQAALTDALNTAGNGDEVAPTALWLFWSLRRSGQQRTASELIAAVPTDLQVHLHRAEHRLLLSYQGSISLDSLRNDLRERNDPEVESLYLYGLAFSLLTTRRVGEAKEILEEIRTIGAWSSLPYLAAEADLARMAAPCPGPLPSLPAERRWRRCLAEETGISKKR
jgi:tetratricopeptide (TPR) repeat protein